jgi:flagellar basal-body rod modification protein FlgD
MDVGSANTLGLPISLATAAQTQSKSKSIDSVETVSKDEFLQLLVAQLKNQDPIEPVKNEAFLAQLATFSSLEQLVSIKEGINKLVGFTTDGTTDSTNTQTQSSSKG